MIVAAAPRTARRRALIGAATLLALVLCGCSTLPTDGQVRTRPDTGSGSGTQAPYFAPPGPTAGDNREGVVRGFLLAMQANPPSTAVARSFLSRSARSTWKPVQGTIVYDGSSVKTEGDLVRARLSDAHQLDPRGSWDTKPVTTAEPLDFSLVKEAGEWRIDNPPNALAVPASYFPSLFVPFELYFFDRTGTVLVPARVYLPRGEQTATNLVRGLLAGPPDALAGVVTTVLPAQSDLDLGVLVSDAGVAEVPLGPGVLRLPPDELERVLVQLAWTLRQVPGITRIKLTVDGLSVPLPEGQADVGVREGAEYDPVAAPERLPVGIVDGRVVRIDDDEVIRVGGPFGRGFALRSVAMDAEGHRLAAVADNGARLYVAPDSGPTAAGRVKVAFQGATNLLRPQFDRFGSIWSVDKTARGAVVHVTTGEVDRVVEVPGISGRGVVAFTVTRDGARIAAALAGREVPRLVISGIVRDADGNVLRALAPSTVDVGQSDLGTVRDLGQIGATTLALLTQPESGPGRIVFVELDGSPGEPGAGTPDLVPGTVLSLAVGPDPTLPLVVVTGESRLLQLDASGQWTRSTLTKVRAAAYPD